MNAPRSRSLPRLAGMLLFGGALVALPGCASVADGEAMHPLTGKTWKLVGIETGDNATPVPRALQANHTLTFLPGGQVQMQLDCNRGSADWSASDRATANGALTIGPVASTRALCPEPSFGEGLAMNLSSTSGFTLADGGKGLVIRTERAVYSFAAD